MILPDRYRRFPTPESEPVLLDDWTADDDLNDREVSGQYDPVFDPFDHLEPGESAAEEWSGSGDDTWR